MNHPPKAKVLVWDLPIRIFHWLFAGSVSASLLFAMFGEHTALFPWHMIIGIAAGFLALLRIVLGFVGSRHASLRPIIAAPWQVTRYIADTAMGKATRYAGHNPLASLTYLLMLSLLALVIATGLNMGNELAEEAHEILAYALLGTIVAHLAGIAFHTARYRENIAASMIHGRKEAPPSEATPSARPILGLAVLAVSLLFIGKLFASYERAAGTVAIPLIGASISLGEGEEERGDDDHREARRKHRERDHD